MPPVPGPVYNWLCVLSSVSDVLGNAAKIHAKRALQAGTHSGTGGNVYRSHTQTDDSQPTAEVDRRTERAPVAATQLYSGQGTARTTGEVCARSQILRTPFDWYPGIAAHESREDSKHSPDIASRFCLCCY